MTVQLTLFIITFTGIVTASNVQILKGELDSAVSLRCEITHLPSNAVITWVFRPKTPTKNGIKWLPLYANARRLTQNNQRFIVDYAGYHVLAKKHLSILTINQINSTDEGIYKCKSNQHHSAVNIFNLTVTPSMKISPNDGIIEFNQIHTPMNLSCTVRELPSHTLDPSKLKWYHNNHEVNHKLNSQSMTKYPPHNQATLTLYIHRLSPNDSGVFQCVYDHGLISRDIQIIHTSSVLEYSKSRSRKNISSYLSFIFLLLVIGIQR